MSFLSRTYLRWHDLFPQVPTHEEVFSELSQLDRLGILLLLSRLNIHQYLDAMQRDSDDAIALQGFLICNLLSQEVIDRAKARFGLARIDLHRAIHLQQTLTLFKWAVLHGAKSGGLHPDSGPQVLERVGKSLLMTSDLLFSPEMREATNAAKNAPSPETYLDILLTSWSGIEVNNPPAVENSFVRTEIIFRELASKDPGFLHLSNEFNAQTGLSLDAYVDMNFGVISYYFLKSQKELIADASLFALNPKTFFGKMDVTESAKFWKMESASVEQLEDALRVPTKLKPFHDFTCLRVKPFLAINEDAVLCINPGFVQEKLEIGLFWAIANQLKGGARKQLFDTWGDLFQQYVSWLVGSAVDTSIEAFHSFPMFEGKQSHHEAFDAVLIAGTCCAVIECKGGFLKSNSKYAEDRNELIEDLDRKFGIGEPGAGIEQLVRKIGQVSDPSNPKRRTLQDSDFSKVEQIIPVLVLQDRCASSIFVAPWLGQRFSDEMKNKRVTTSVPCSGLVVIGIEELETLRRLVVSRQTSFMECIRERIRLGDPKPGRMLFDFSDAISQLLLQKGITHVPDDDFSSRFEAILSRVSNRFYGPSVDGEELRNS